MTDDEVPVVNEADIDGDPLASIGQRIGARVIDWLILLMVMVPLVVLAVGSDPDVRPPTWSIVLSILLPFVYETVMVMWRGQTIGKIVLGIELVRFRDGSRPGFGVAALRAFPAAVLMALLGQLALVALVFVYFTAGFVKTRRGALDTLAGTVVIVARDVE